jgi:hypothetical protein
VIEFYKDAPLGKSIDHVSRRLARADVWVPTEGVCEPGNRLLLKTSRDIRSRDWAYAYTDEPELLAAFPKGAPFVKMAFRDAFTMIAKDSRFGGIFINGPKRKRRLSS